MASGNLSEFFKTIYFSLLAIFKAKSKAQHVESARMTQTRLKSLSRRNMDQPLQGAIWFGRKKNGLSQRGAVCTFEEFKEVFGKEPVAVPTHSGRRLSNISQYRLAAYVATLPSYDSVLHLT